MTTLFVLALVEAMIALEVQKRDAAAFRTRDHRLSTNTDS